MRDDALCMEAQRMATGAHIHEVAGNLAGYEDNLAGAGRMAERIRLGDESADTAESLTARIRLAAAFETRLRAFVVQRRLASL